MEELLTRVELALTGEHGPIPYDVAELIRDLRDAMEEYYWDSYHLEEL